jgi:hypothetical protein
LPERLNNCGAGSLNAAIAASRQKWRPRAPFLASDRPPKYIIKAFWQGVLYASALNRDFAELFFLPVYGILFSRRLPHV